MPKLTVTGRFIGGPLFHPRKSDDDKDPKYGLTLVLDDGQEKKIATAMQEVVAEKWNGKPPAGTQNWAVRKGDDPEYESFEKFYINPKANSVTKDGAPAKRPGTFIKRQGVIYEVKQDENIIYPGCYVAVEIDVYAYDGDKAKSIKPGVSVGLNKVLFLRDGERLSTEISAEEAFGDFESEIAEGDNKGAAPAASGGQSLTDMIGF